MPTDLALRAYLPSCSLLLIRPALQKWAAGLALLGLLACAAPTPARAQGSAADYERAQRVSGRYQNQVFRTQIEPNWLPGGRRFWYRVATEPRVFEFVLVDAETGKKTTYPKQDELIAALDPAERPDRKAGSHSDSVPRRSARTGAETFLHIENRGPGPVKLFWFDTAGQRQAYGEVAPNAEHQQHTFAGHVWLLVDGQGQELGLIEAQAGGRHILLEGKPLPRSPSARTPRGPAIRTSPRSPDDRWEAFVRNDNLWLRDRQSNEEHALSSDGSAEDRYQGPFYWSPDSRFLLVMQVRPPQQRQVQMIETAPSDQVQPRLKTINYLKPGDRVAEPRPRLFAATTRTAIPVADEPFANPWAIDQIRWAADSSRVTLRFNARGHQSLRLLALDTQGRVYTLIDESSKTFVDYAHKSWNAWLDDAQEILWMSERDGWNHIHVFDAATGQPKRQLTQGPWVVRRIERLDTERGQLWFWAMGVRPEQDPYHEHLCRVNLDGSGFVILTDGDGTHTARFSPDQRFLVATWSRVDQPPVTELRRADTGEKIAELERGDASRLLQLDWPMPERFVAKGRDGQTDIYGIIIKPSRFDPKKKYPVIEEIYAGPQGAFVPKDWSLQVRKLQLAELGFVVVQIDGMGTNWRSKAFHDVCWKNLADGGFPDRIAWLRAAAATRPWMDLERVGIFGGSAGGQNALAGLLHHGDFYRVGVADCGCHDNRMDKIWWNELWMGWPVDESYERSSNVTHAHKLQGKLLLIVGELDTNVDPASTLQVAAALVKANKDFDLLIMPGVGHGAAGHPYAQRRLRDFFVRHLHGVEPRHTSASNPSSGDRP
ncbi:MAG TPA: prolyl oligopeptidase family serine peptidase [Gemmatales bacterium]|nr:prolyl oligopeptidase family serine peptidase [Gemmatales bacterium]HMP58984.1 prolyl oligopeptidase family serine peptidase [Gemmatales bacterium]